MVMEVGWREMGRERSFLTLTVTVEVLEDKT